MNATAPRKPIGLDIPLRRLTYVTRTLGEAKNDLAERLGIREPDNRVDAVRALNDVLGRFEPETETTREAFREHATKALESWFPDAESAKAAIWTTFDAPRPSTNGKHPPDEDSPEVQIMSLEKLLEDPDALKPPEEQLFPLAWKGRVTLLSAREKFGKSTTVRGAIAAKSHGRPFMGRTPTAGNCLLLALEEHLQDVVRSLQGFDAHGPAVFIVNRLGADPFETLAHAIGETDAELVAVDTLATFVEALSLESGDAAGWTAVMQRFGRIARETGAGIVLVHHGRKEDGSYRDSTAIGAGADMLLALSDGEVEGVKKLAPKGRWELRPMSFRIRPATEGRPAAFDLTSGDLSMDMKVFLYVQGHPGCSTRAIREGVTGNNEQKAMAVTRLERGGYIRDQGGQRGNAYHAMKAFGGGQ